MALPPHFATGPRAQVSMGPRPYAHSHCIDCLYKQPHVCDNSEPTLYSPDTASFAGLKLQDAPPIAREIPGAWAEPEPQYKLRPSHQPGLHVEPAVSTPRFTAYAVPDPDRTGEPGPQFRSYLPTNSSPRQDAFPYKWPQTWDPHPTTPGLFWMHRRWTDGRCPRVRWVSPSCTRQ